MVVAARHKQTLLRATVITSAKQTLPRRSAQPISHLSCCLAGTHRASCWQEPEHWDIVGGGWAELGDANYPDVRTSPERTLNFSSPLTLTLTLKQRVHQGMLVFGGAGAWCLAPTVAMQVMLDGIAQHKDRFFDYSQLRARESFTGKGNPLLRIHAINAYLKI